MSFHIVKDKVWNMFETLNSYLDCCDDETHRINVKEMKNVIYIYYGNDFVGTMEKHPFFRHFNIEKFYEFFKVYEEFCDWGSDELILSCTEMQRKERCDCFEIRFENSERKCSFYLYGISLNKVYSFLLSLKKDKVNPSRFLFKAPDEERFKTFCKENLSSAQSQTTRILSHIVCDRDKKDIVKDIISRDFPKCTIHEVESNGALCLLVDDICIQEYPKKCTDVIYEYHDDHEGHCELRCFMPSKYYLPLFTII